MKPQRTAQDLAQAAQQQETLARQFRQHFERNWRGSTDEDDDEYWVMEKAMNTMYHATVKEDRA